MLERWTQIRIGVGIEDDQEEWRLNRRLVQSSKLSEWKLGEHVIVH